MEQNNRVKEGLFGSPVIPKFRLSYNSVHKVSKNMGSHIQK
jgi:hypothetical protein